MNSMRRKRANTNMAKEQLEKALIVGNNMRMLQEGLDNVLNHLKTVNDDGFERIDMIARSIGESQLVEQ